jgi:tetratricopeptide (TPR) repeat protein
MSQISYRMVSLAPLLALIAGSQASDAAYAPVLLEALDPSRIAARACGSPGRQAQLMHSLTLAAAAAAPLSEGARVMPLYPDLDAGRFVPSTGNELALRYFRQGLTLTYSFNHAGAVRSFREAQRPDPNCALCFWGEAMALGPNINAPMDGRDVPSALAALERSQALAAGASPLERALIAALATRYSADPAADRAALDSAYADAMVKVAAQFPDHDEVAVLTAEAVMDTSPWNYWQADKTTPVGRSLTAVQLLEGVLKRNPGHAQAAHLYIHMMENSRDPRLAEAAADSLAASGLKNAGHLIHMPSHIYINVGRQVDSMKVNVAAARSDEAFIRESGDQSIFRYGYYPHNVHFIVASAQLSGDMATAIREARRLRGVLDPATSEKVAWIQVIDAAPFTAAAQFGNPALILGMAEPDARLPYPRAIRHYARALARAQQRDAKGFEAEIAAMNAYKGHEGLAAMVAQGVPAPDLLQLAEHVARGKLAYAGGDYAGAADHYRKAVAVEATVPYTEPAYWYYPVRQSLGAALLAGGKAEEASEAFRGALLQAPKNAWVLYGLAQSEARLGNGAEAAAARKAFKQAWRGDPRWLRLERL